MAFCARCNRKYKTAQALEQHMRDSPAHHATFDCLLCNRQFISDEALQQHMRDSPVHQTRFDCLPCNRHFTNNEALQQHIQNSPAHQATFDCSQCDRYFSSAEALEQHIRDSPAHQTAFDCVPCGRQFNSDEALQMHLRDSPAHATVTQAARITDSFHMRPHEHGDVLRALEAYGLSYGFYPLDDPDRALEEYDTKVCGTFTCLNRACHSRTWASLVVPITIRRYTGRLYNARVYYQRCKKCDSLSQPELDDSYAERISYRLARWSGAPVEEQPFSGDSRGPHEKELCEGCKVGRCLRSRL